VRSKIKVKMHHDWENGYRMALVVKFPACSHFSTTRIFRIFHILRINGWNSFVTYLWNDPQILLHFVVCENVTDSVGKSGFLQQSHETSY